MTLILLAPTSVRLTVNSVFSSTGAAAAAAPPPAAIIGMPIGIAADTPSSLSSAFTRLLSSRTLMPLM